MKSTADALSKVAESVKKLTKERDDALSAQFAAEGKVEDGNHKIEELEGTISNLQNEIKDRESKAIVLEEAEKKADHDVQAIANQALEISSD